MVLAPQRATLTATVGGTSILGITDITITDKTTLEDITCDADTAIRRFPTIDDADAKISVITDPADAGQIALLAGKAAHTKLSMVCTKGTTPKTFTFSAYVSDVGYSKGPKDTQRTDFTFGISGGVVVS